MTYAMNEYLLHGDMGYILEEASWWLCHNYLIWWLCHIFLFWWLWHDYLYLVTLSHYLFWQPCCKFCGV